MSLRGQKCNRQNRQSVMLSKAFGPFIQIGAALNKAFLAEGFGVKRLTLNLNGNLNYYHVYQGFRLQVSLVIRSKYVLPFSTANLEFADKKSIFDQKIVILDQF